MTPDRQDNAATVARVVSAWAAVGITSWADAAAAAAFAYSVLLILEWVWRRLLRPQAEMRGWVKRRRRRETDFTDLDG